MHSDPRHTGADGRTEDCSQDGDSRPVIVWGVILIAAALIFVGVMSWPKSAKSADRVYRDGFEIEDPCAGATPAGYAVRYRTWQETWSAPNGSVQAAFPNSIGSAVPVGADRQQIVTVPFVALPGQYAAIFFDPAQANRSIGYGQPRPALAMFVGISECPADLRMTRERQFCTRFANTGAITWITYPSPGACQIEAGRTYYLSITPHDPVTGDYWCPDPERSGCEVQAVHRGQ